jgi:hypothetical protein
MWASEPVPFDPMENATQGYQKTTTNDTRRQFSMIHEYPLDGNRPWWRTCLKIRKANELLQRRSRNDYKSIQPQYGGTATNSDTISTSIQRVPHTRCWLFWLYRNKLSSKPTRLILSFRGLGGVLSKPNIQSVISNSMKLVSK